MTAPMATTSTASEMPPSAVSTSMGMASWPIRSARPILDILADCDDDDPATRPYAIELCDGRDNDCDSYVDEGFPVGVDLDGDGVAACDDCVDDPASCVPPDCDDLDPNVYPGARMATCDDLGLDWDCDPDTPTDPDFDGDGATLCLDGDCDDDLPETYPGAPELCDAADNDCNGLVDDGLEDDSTATRHGPWAPVSRPTTVTTRIRR